jgi:hypothetical protein
MGFSRGFWCGVAAVLAASPNALAEDIGREPLAPPDRAASALSARGPSASHGATAVDPDAEPLSSRGPALSPGRPPPDYLADEARPTRRWYGWQTLIVDGAASVALLTLASQSRSSNDGWLAPVTGTYLLASPIIHVAHGHPGKALLSLGIRGVGPLLIAAAFASGSSSGELGTVNGPLLVLGVLAIPAAIAVDAAAIAREGTPHEDASSFVLRMGFSPWIDTRHGAGGLLVNLSL